MHFIKRFILNSSVFKTFVFNSCAHGIILHGIDAGLDAGKRFGRHFYHSILGQEKAVRAVGISGVRLTWSQLEYVSVWYVEVTSGPIFCRARVYVLFYKKIFFKKT